MTAATAPVHEYDVPETRDTSALPYFDFKINGEAFRLLMPKLSIAANLIALTERRADTEIATLGLNLISLLWNFIDYIEEGEPEPPKIAAPIDPDKPTAKPKMIDNPHAGRLCGRARIMQRLHDTHDALDIADLLPIFVDAASVMFKRPTGPLRESSSKRSGGGRASSARSSGKRASSRRR